MILNNFAAAARSRFLLEMMATAAVETERGLNKDWDCCYRVKDGKCSWGVNEGMTRNSALSCFHPVIGGGGGGGRTCRECGIDFWLDEAAAAAVENLGRFCVVEEEMESSHFKSQVG